MRIFGCPTPDTHIHPEIEDVKEKKEGNWDVAPKPITTRLVLCEDASH